MKNISWKSVAVGVIGTALFLKFVAPRVPALAPVARVLS